jgi:hypothetical protein
MITCVGEYNLLNEVDESLGRHGLIMAYLYMQEEYLVHTHGLAWRTNLLWRGIRPRQDSSKSLTYYLYPDRVWV